MMPSLFAISPDVFAPLRPATGDSQNARNRGTNSANVRSCSSSLLWVCCGVGDSCWPAALSSASISSRRICSAQRWVLALDVNGEARRTRRRQPAASVQNRFASSPPEPCARAFTVTFILRVAFCEARLSGWDCPTPDGEAGGFCSRARSHASTSAARKRQPESRRIAPGSSPARARR
jgi:hypothetical protein